jgi:hypothetical protein
MPMFTRGAMALVAGALLAAAACGPPEGPSGPDATTSGGGSDGGSGGGGSSAPAAPAAAPSSDGISTLTLAFDRVRGGRNDFTSVDLDVVALATFVNGDPRYANADSPCDGGAPSALRDLPMRVTLDLTSTGATPFTAIDVGGGGELRELWLVLRSGTLYHGYAVDKIHAGTLCKMGDGLQYTLVRLRLPSPASLDGGADHAIAITFGSDQIVERAGSFSFQPSFPIRVDP